jgi:hypothetical protein
MRPNDEMFGRFPFYPTDCFEPFTALIVQSVPSVANEVCHLAAGQE